MRRLRRAGLALLLSVALGAAGCGSDGESPSAPVVEDPGPVHVHGLGINPRDRALYVATHTGLFRAGPGESSATRVGDRQQDTMGFTVVGADRFLGSGHPDARDDLPPFLGLIESTDGGRSWHPVSLLGKADFHVLEAAGERVYGFGSDFETRTARFLVSDDRGRTWDERSVPEPLISLAPDPGDPDRLVASGQRAIYASGDGGRSWRRRSRAVGLLGWERPDRLILVTGRGEVASSRDGTRWSKEGSVGGQPAAFEAERDGLYVALHDGTIKRSTDGGRTWTVRARP